ncbi:tyrosine-protein phosphatase [Streptomyces sp. JH14]|uniref:tyrosine-protein phosphatase n=1 Tax=Streptomyces sp. JH14 TaxID=2793630 RepID=UPI0023F6A17A|nr:tyrosine-protein phosphatase [Streptomyces sp. JH14]MDF6043035.1 tyrosine-protein phosphatase [Streptomyces sp. JH14]
MARTAAAGPALVPPPDCYTPTPHDPGRRLTGFAGFGVISACVHRALREIPSHCIAGKDRTGWGNAALLTAFGVPRTTVMSDCPASDDYRAEANAAALASMPAAQAAVYKPLPDVRPEYLNSGFQEVEQKYGAFAAYEKQALGLDGKDVRDLKRDLLVG